MMSYSDRQAGRSRTQAETAGLFFSCRRSLLQDRSRVRPFAIRAEQGIAGPCYMTAASSDLL